MTNTNETPNETTTPTDPVPTEPLEETGRHRAIFPSLEEARQVTPPSDRFRIFLVFKGEGSLGYTWGQSSEGAVVNIARHDGYTARVGEPKVARITKQVIADKLASFTDEELAAMGLTRKKSKK